MYYVQLGDYKCTAPFGVITDCNSPDFNGVDGILGFGLPKAGEEGRELPTPLLFAMTDQENKMSNAKDLTRKFSFFSTDTDGMFKSMLIVFALHAVCPLYAVLLMLAIFAPALSVCANGAAPACLS